MTAEEIFEKIMETGEPETVYFILKHTFDENSDDSKHTEIFLKVYVDYDEVSKAFERKLAKGMTPNFGEYIELCIIECQVEQDDIKDLTPEIVNAEWLYINSYIEYLRSEEIHYDYKSVEGAVLVFWTWNRFVGYSRKCSEIRFGYSGETESICIPKDSVIETQCSVLCEKDEVDGLSKEELRKVIYKHLEKKEWKWNNSPYRYADEFLDEE